MEVTFWQLNKRINSTKIPTTVGTNLNAVYYKDVTDIHNPSIQVSTANMNTTFNYAKIGSIYYFVDSIEAMTNNVWRVNLKIDLLATYKSKILNTEVFALYSSSDFNKNLTDNRLATDGNIITQSSHVEIPGFPYSQGAAGWGQFGLTVVGYVTGDVPSHATATVTYFLTPRQMQLVVESLLDPSFMEWILQYFTNPFDAIVECFWMPFDVSKFTTLASATVKIAGREITTSDGDTITGSISYRNPSDLLGQRVSLDIPWIYDDFRNLSNYTTMNLFLPVVGNTQLDPNLFYGESSMNIECVLDWSSGAIIYDIVKGSFPYQSVISRLSANAKTTIPIGQLQSSFGKIMQTLVNVGVGIAFTQMPYMMPAALTSFAGAASVALRRNEIHQNGAFSGSFLSSNIGPQDAVLTIQANDTSDMPENMANILGRPCYKKVLIANCSGYLQTTNASVIIDGFYNESQAINNILNGGVYIE